MDRLKAALLTDLPFVERGDPCAPRGMILVGLPGTGKRMVAECIPQALVSGSEPDRTMLLDLLEEKHEAIIRRVSSGQKMPFLIAIVECPWELKPGMLRANAFDSIWHFGLPDLPARARHLDRLAARFDRSPVNWYSIVIDRATHGCTFSELDAIYRKAWRTTHPKAPNERQLLSAANDWTCQLLGRGAELVRMNAWAKSHALEVK